MNKKFLDKNDFIKKVEELQNSYWTKTFRDRWKYISPVIDELKKINPSSMLEIGAYQINLSSISDNMDLKEENIDLHNLNNKKYIQDATNLPWKISDKKYDCVLALQVFEHLKGKQLGVFNEIRRISQAAILSFPYLWDIPGNCHHMIDKNIISEWTNNMTPKKIISLGPNSPRQRIIYIFEF